MPRPGGLTQAASALLAMGSALAQFLESHDASCVCCQCTVLHAGEDATDLLTFLAVLIEAKAREEWAQCAERRPHSDLLHACMAG
jgi:hypothetical protein